MTTALDAVIICDNGRYLKLVPSLDQLGRMLFHIVVQLLNKSLFEEALQQATYLLKYTELAKKCTSCVGQNVLRELVTLASHMSETLWKGAVKMEQLRGSKTKVQADIGLVLRWRKLSLQFAAEGNSSIESHVERILKTANKFQKDCGANSVDYGTLSHFLETAFRMVAERTELWNCNKTLETASLNSIVELGFHCGRVCQKSGKAKEALAVFNLLQDIMSRLMNSCESICQSVLETYVCICLACKAAATMSSLMESSESVPKEKDFESVNQIFDDLNENLVHVLANANVPSSLLGTLSDSLEYVRSILQHTSNKQADRTKDKDKSNKGWKPSLPQRTFHKVQQLFSSYVKVLELQRQSSNARARNGDVDGQQFREQVQKATHRQLSIHSFMASLYQDRMQWESCQGAKSNSKSRYM